MSHVAKFCRTVEAAAPESLLLNRYRAWLLRSPSGNSTRQSLGLEAIGAFEYNDYATAPKTSAFDQLHLAVPLSPPGRKGSKGGLPKAPLKLMGIGSSSESCRHIMDAQIFRSIHVQMQQMCYISMSHFCTCHVQASWAPARTRADGQFKTVLPLASMRRQAGERT